MNEDIQRALEVLKSGGIILYPTDTIWGIGCDACNAEAVDKVFKIKGRDAKKSMIILLDSPGKIASYVEEVPDVAYDLVEFAEKPLTIIYSQAKNLAPNVINQDGSIGIRITGDEFSKRLIQRFRKPIVSTSANLSNQSSPANFSEIAAELLSAIDYVVKWKQEDAQAQRPSTIMKLEPDGRFIFLRK